MQRRSKIRTELGVDFIVKHLPGVPILVSHLNVQSLTQGLEEVQIQAQTSGTCVLHRVIALLPFKGYSRTKVHVVKKDNVFQVAEKLHGRRQTVALLGAHPLRFIAQFPVRAINPGPSTSPSDRGVVLADGLLLKLHPDELVPEEEAVIALMDVQSADDHICLTGLYVVRFLPFFGGHFGQGPVGAKIQRHSESLDEDFRYRRGPRLPPSAEEVPSPGGLRERPATPRKFGIHGDPSEMPDPRSGTDRRVEKQQSIKGYVLEVSVELSETSPVQLCKGQYPRNHVVRVELSDPAMALLPVFHTAPPEIRSRGQAILRYEV